MNKQVPVWCVLRPERTSPSRPTENMPKLCKLPFRFDVHLYVLKVCSVLGAMMYSTFFLSLLVDVVVGADHPPPLWSPSRCLTMRT